MGINTTAPSDPGTSLGQILVRTLARIGEDCGDQEPDYSLLLRRTLIAELVAPSGQVYIAKIGDATELGREFSRHKEVHAAFPSLLPYPAALHNEDDTSVFLMTGLDVTSLSPTSPFAPLENGAHSIGEFLTAAHKSFAVDDNESDYGPLVERVLGTLPPDLVGKVRNDISGFGERQRGALSHSHQHCDLSFNNLASVNGKLAVLDWEDFSEISFPGFDLAILVGSYLRHKASGWHEIGRNQGSSQLRDLVTRTVPELGLSVDDFMQLLPIYYLLFYDLKVRHGYGDIVRDMILEFLRDY